MDNFPIQSLMCDARVTRLDVAIDCIGISPADVFFFNKKVWNSSGLTTGLQTSNFYVEGGKKKSPHGDPKKRANLVVYDKCEEKLSRGVKPIFGDETHTRIEISLRKNCLLTSLRKIKFPFADWEIRRINTENSPFEPWLWQLMFDSTRIRGTGEAYGLLPAKIQDQAKLDEDHTPYDLITEKEIWSHWQEALFRSPVGPLVKWAETDPGLLMPDYSVKFPDK